MVVLVVVSSNSRGLQAKKGKCITTTGRPVTEGS